MSSLPCTPRGSREREPQGEPTGQQVKEEGGSECRSVMGRIGVVTSPHAKAGRLPCGVGGREASVNRRRRCAEKSAGSQWLLLVLQPPPKFISVAGSAVVTPRLTSRPMRQPRPVEEVSSAGGAVLGRISQGRCPRPEPYEAKVPSAVLRGGGDGDILSLPGDHASDPAKGTKCRYRGTFSHSGGSRRPARLLFPDFPHF